MRKKFSPTKLNIYLKKGKIKIQSALFLWFYILFIQCRRSQEHLSRASWGVYSLIGWFPNESNDRSWIQIFEDKRREKIFKPHAKLNLLKENIPEKNFSHQNHIFFFTQNKARKKLHSFIFFGKICLVKILSL